VTLQVHKQNVTKLAELIRDSYKRRCDPLFLKRVSALTVVVEIGIDKLFRDYVHAFLGNSEIFSAVVSSSIITLQLLLRILPSDARQYFSLAA